MTEIAGGLCKEQGGIRSVDFLAIIDYTYVYLPLVIVEDNNHGERTGLLIQMRGGYVM